MRGLLHLALAHARHHSGRTSILTLCLAVAAILPLATSTIMERYEAELSARAQSTPLIAGPRGNRFDLTLSALFFRPSNLEPVRVALLERIQAEGRGTAVPLHTRFSAQGESVVGTSLDYFDQRGLRAADGQLPALIGDAVVGSAVAERLDLAPGASVYSDPVKLYDIAQPASIQLLVTGTLEPQGTPDDEAIFVDIKTAWVIEGLAHGHEEVTTEGALDEDFVLSRSEDSVVISPALIEHGRITYENLRDFHLHGNRAELPLSSILFFPADQKAETLLRADLNSTQNIQAVAPDRVVEELLQVALRIKDLLDGLSVILIGSTILFCALVLTLTARLRQEEFRALHAMGCSSGATRHLILLELLIISGLAASLALVSMGLLDFLLPELTRVL